MQSHALRTKTIPLKLLSAITRDCGTSGYAVYSVLLCHATTKGADIGKSFPGKELISKEAHISVSTTFRAINALTKHRYILVRKRKASDGYYSNVYWIAWIRKRHWRWSKSELEFVGNSEHSHRSI